MEARLTGIIEGRCSGLEHRVIDSEQCNKERLISLETMCSEAESGRVDIEKRVDDLKLEVHRINCLLKRETLDSNHNKSSIFEPKESAHDTPHARSAADGPNGHLSAHLNPDYEIGSQSHISTNGTTSLANGLKSNPNSTSPKATNSFNPTQPKNSISQFNPTQPAVFFDTNLWAGPFPTNPLHGLLQHLVVFS
jgi:hypothetical protein